LGYALLVVVQQLCILVTNVLIAVGVHSVLLVKQLQDLYAFVSVVISVYYAVPVLHAQSVVI